MNTQSSRYDATKRLEICLSEVGMPPIVASEHATRQQSSHNVRRSHRETAKGELTRCSVKRRDYQRVRFLVL